MDCRELGLDSKAARCDFIFFSNNLIAALELKRGRMRASRVVQQLQAGADIADQSSAIEGVSPFHSCRGVRRQDSQGRVY